MYHFVVVQLVGQPVAKNDLIRPRSGWEGAVNPADDAMLDARSYLPAYPWPIALVGVPSWAKIPRFKDGTVHAIHYKRDNVRPVIIASLI